MKILISITTLCVILALSVVVYLQQDPAVESSSPVSFNEPAETPAVAPLVEVTAENLTVPWEILFLPDGEILVTERPGRIVLLKSGREYEIDSIRSRGEGGLLGAALHPDFAENQFLYLYETTEVSGQTSNQIVRYVLAEEGLQLDKIILENLPGALYHDGGRIKFGPDGFLYVTVGDALRPEEAANPDSLEGTILRLTPDGEPAPQNPFNSLVYSYGHRNPQGITWDDTGALWSSEHGRSGVRSGFDEINRIESGGDYGWPNSEGDNVATGTIAPARHSTADITWAPGDLTYLAGSLYMPGLRGQALYEAVLENGEIVSWHEHFVGDYGRLRTVQVGPDGLLYLLTSNRDGRGNTIADGDDRIIRVNPELLTRQ